MNLSIPSLQAAYSTGALTPDALIGQLYARIAQADPAIWITLLERSEVEPYLARLCTAEARKLPLYGIPFAIKDNIDLGGTLTTAACPAYAYEATQSAHVVQRLIGAGAIPIGKTNLDQFATGLVGTRSPYGVPGNAFNAEFISGGSSSGSALAVALGLVSFALGTDTAGSGRVPASFNNIIGLKPTCGLLSTSGVVPACRSLDCVSIFSLTAGDAKQVLDVAAHFDPQDAFMRSDLFAGGSDLLTGCSETGSGRKAVGSGKNCGAVAENLNSNTARIIGVPRKEQLEFFGDAEAARLFDEAVERLATLGVTVKEIDFTPFLDAARLLYGGPWLAERYIVVEQLLREQPDALLDVTRTIISGGADISAADAFCADYRLRALKRLADTQLAEVDVIMTPTAGTVYRIAEVEAEPFTLNTNLGRYTNFMNLLDFSAVAVPSGFRADGQPLGVTFFGRRGQDCRLLRLAARYHAACGVCLGVSSYPVPKADGEPCAAAVQADDALVTTAATQAAAVDTGSAPAKAAVASERINLVVCGAHMEGLVLNHQLLELGATFVERTQTTADYRFYRLPGLPARPALVRCPQAESGQVSEIGVEVWSVALSAVGRLLPKIASPLGLGKVFLCDGRQEVGFIADASAIIGAEEITRFGNWRDYLKSL